MRVFPYVRSTLTLVYGLNQKRSGGGKCFPISLYLGTNDRESLYRGRSSMTNRIYFLLFPPGGLPALSQVWQHAKLSDALSWDPSVI